MSGEGTSPPNGASSQPAARTPGELADENHDALMSGPPVRRADAETRQQPVEPLAPAGVGGNRGLMIVALWAPLVFTLAVVCVAFQGQHARDLDARWVLHTVEVKDQIEHVNSLIRDIGAGERGYLLTGDASFLTLYENALKEIPTQSDRLAHLIEDNPTQVTNVAHLQTLIAEKMSVAAQALSLVQLEKIPLTIEMYRDTQEKPLNDEIRAQVDAMTAEEDRLLSERENVFTLQVKSQKKEMIGLVAVEIVLIVGLTLLMLRLRKLQLTVDARIDEANVMTDQAQTSTLEAIVRTDQAEARAGEAKTRTDVAEATTDLLYTCVSHLSDIVLITEAESLVEPGPRIVFVNKAFERMTGYTAAEVLGQSPRFLQGEKTDRRILDEIHQAVAERKPIRRQIINYRKDGSEFWLDIDIVPIFDATGKCTHFAGIERDITERKQAEEVRRTTEERYRTLFDYAPDGILIVSPENIYIDANVSICQMLGYTRDELIGLGIPQILAETELARVEPTLSVIRSKTDHHHEWKFRRKDGSILEVDAFSSLMPDGNVLAMIRDITDRKRNEERFRLLVDSNAQGVFFWNTRGEISGGNDAFLHLLRYTREDLEAGLIGWVAMTPPEYAHLDQIALEQITAKGACAPYEKEFIRKDGVRVFVLIGAATFKDRPEEGVAFVLDLTERKCATEQIAEQAALLDEAQDAIIVRDLEGKAIYWNKGAERMYGWTRQEALGLNMSELLFADPKAYAEVTALTLSHGKWSGDLKYLTKDKREITIAARWTLIRDEEGGPKSVLAINTDITEKKKIEAQFMRAQRMESIGTLAGGIAHDLNNILAPIMMSIDILKLTATDPQARNILDTIEVSAKRGSDIVRQVLSFARGLEGERVEIQPAHLLKDLENIIKNTFPKNIRLQFSIPNDTWAILGDPTQVHQILLNLCVNARDAMPRGGNLIFGVENSVLDEHYAAMHIEARPGRYVKISVTDTGTGIPQGILDKIFEPFFTTKEIDEGTGLGLSTVLAIVKSHEGVIDVYSEPGKGTTFKVYLPAVKLSAEAQKLVTQQISVPRGKGETILVVDDEASILTITTQTLQAFGYVVLTATDGAEAIAVYARHEGEIAVVLTDMSMPIMDGAALIRALTKINPAIKIIAASGLHANGDAAKASGAGVKHFLTKPYTAGALLKAIRMILDGA
jgi:PAS domain S-box-containing protein